MVFLLDKLAGVSVNVVTNMLATPGRQRTQSLKRRLHTSRKGGRLGLLRGVWNIQKHKKEPTLILNSQKKIRIENNDERSTVIVTYGHRLSAVCLSSPITWRQWPYNIILHRSAVPSLCYKSAHNAGGPSRCSCLWFVLLRVKTSIARRRVFCQTLLHTIYHYVLIWQVYGH